MKLYSFFAIVAAALMMVACGNNQNNKAADEQAQVAQAVMIDSVLAEGEALAGQLIEIEGVCTHICSHSASKIFLLGENEVKTIRVEAAELGSFDQKCVNSIVKVKGILHEERIDEAYLQAWEQRIANKTEEKHGEGDGEGGCDTEKAARGETANTSEGRIADFRAKIAARKEADGKEYLSFYYVEAQEYEVVE
ncbi:MAG: hypothetical protein IIU85_00215 [Rikenellaceae bacterium]|nr:hypothetical protein [Rikenellaceae bacterium]